ncbi:unnamed protein product [Victoria cruziana]
MEAPPSQMISHGDGGSNFEIEDDEDKLTDQCCSCCYYCTQNLFDYICCSLF